MRFVLILVDMRSTDSKSPLCGSQNEMEKSIRDIRIHMSNTGQSTSSINACAVRWGPDDR